MCVLLSVYPCVFVSMLTVCAHVSLCVCVGLCVSMCERV